jgi:1-acyl-sn-glycerol-3-phosphate acyltransferase
MIRTAWFALHLLLATIPLSLLVIIGSYAGASPRFYDRIPRWWAKWLLWAAGVRVSVEGVENLSLDRAQIIVSNHVSWFDVLALAAVTPKRYRFVAKQELGRIPLFGHAWKAAGHISVDRGDNARAVASLRQAGDTVRRDNSSIIIFPEGTRSPTGELQQFKKGAFVLALHNAIDIVPVAVLGTYRIMPKNSWRVRPGRIIVRFGRAVPTAGIDISHRDELIGQVRSQMLQLLGEPARID